MSLTTDVIAALGNGASAGWEMVRPYKEAIFGLCVITGGGIAAFIGGYRRQSRKPEEALDAAAAYATRASVVRIHQDDREAFSSLRSCIAALRESIEDLARETRKNTKAVDDNTDALRRGGGGGGGGRHR